MSKNVTRLTTEPADSQTTSEFSSHDTVSPSHAVDISSETDEFLIYVMIGVGAAVIAIVLVIAVIFVVRSKRRKTRNLEIMRQQRESTGTSSLALTESAHHGGEEGAVNGVHQALYGEDSRLPIITRANSEQPYDDARSLSTNQHEYENKDALQKAVKIDKKVPLKPTTPTFRNNQPKKQQKEQSVERKKTEVDESYYETTFQTLKEDKPMQSVETEVATGGHYQKIWDDTKDKTKAEVDSCQNMTCTDSYPFCANQNNDKNMKKNSIKLPPIKIGLKPESMEIVRGKGKKSESDSDETFPDYVNTSSKVKSPKFKDAKNSMSTPPPCQNKSSGYVNVPDEKTRGQEPDSITHASEEPVSDKRASVYENPDVIKELKLKPGSTDRGKQARKTVPNIYENSETARMKIDLQAKVKRGHSTSSAQTFRPRVVNRLDTNKEAEDRDNPDNDTEYVAMEGNEDKNDYLPMNSPEIEMYYTKMLPSYSFIQRSENKQTNEDLKDMPSQEQDPDMYKSPKPCRPGVYREYTNYSKQQLRYVNFFRSKSQDDLYTYADPRKLSVKDDESNRIQFSKRMTNHN